MIYISQGHENGIGIEILIKSLRDLDQDKINNLHFVCFKKSLIKTLETIFNSSSPKFIIQNNHLHIFQKVLTCTFLENKKNESETICSLNKTLELVEKDPKNNILLTLPSSKDQFKFKDKNFLGHTEFFRHLYPKNELCMVFKSHESQIMLITDHMPIKDISDYIKTKLIIEKTILTLNNFKNYIFPIDEVFFSGINPHAGENNLLGLEDSKISDACKLLSEEILPNKVKFYGPLSADSLFFNFNNSVKQLFVYMFHDQGLCFFKGRYGLSGVHLTLGLPFIRLSVDHGTAFSLFGKNTANNQGLIEVLKFACSMIERKN